MPIPRGWTTIVELAAYLAEHGVHEESDRRRIEALRTEDGRPKLNCDEPGDKVRGVMTAAEALAAETCEGCGGKGDPYEDQQGRRSGCGCARCRPQDAVLLHRHWPEASAKDETARSPGQWTADIRGGSTGNTWDSENWRDYGRLETLYGPQIIELMTAENDEETMRLWAGGAGWAGLMRALFLTLRDEQDERPDNPGHTPWRLRWMKAKFGSLEVRTTGNTKYQYGAIRMIETFSNWICQTCGQPGRVRRADYVRADCDSCFAGASDEDRKSDALSKTWADEAEAFGGTFRGTGYGI